ncbi:MAG: MtrB/PioB family decaheme-associated outer membrane protein [Nitrospinota bacterium]
MAYLNFGLNIKRHFTVLAVFLFAVLAYPSWTPALAQEANADSEGAVSDGMVGSITLGGAAISLDRKDPANNNAGSFKFGEYSGVDEGRYLIGDVKIDYDKKGFYFSLRAEDIGRDSKNVNLEMGRNAGYRFFLDYDQIPHLISDNSKTIHNGTGSGTLTLPAAFTGAANTALMLSDLNTYKKDVVLELERKRIGGGFSIPLGNLDFGVKLKKETKEGTKSIGSVIGDFSGNRQSIVLPEPVDYETDEFTVSLGYTGKKGSVEIKYFLSNFKNKIGYLSWDNPYTGAGPQTVAARTALPPNNEHQKFSVSGGMNLGETTRISAVAEQGKMKQNEALIPYTTQDTSLLPARTNAQAEIATTNLMFNVTSRPVTKLSLTAKYKHYKTDNTTPMDTFLYVRNDGAASDQATTSASHALINLPYDYTKDRITLNGTYNIFSRTNLKLGYVNETMDRSYREVKKTNEGIYKIGINSNKSSIATVRINYSFADRKADTYNYSNLYDQHHTQGYITSSGVTYSNNPEMRKFDIADRERSKFGAKFNLYPSSLIEFGIYYDRMSDKYKNSPLGLQEAENNNFTLDVTIYPSARIALNVFYTIEKIQSRQMGRYFSDSSSSSTQYNDVNRNWQINHFENIPTYGLGLDLFLLGGVLKIDADIIVAESITSIEFNTGSSLTTPQDLPDLKTRLMTLSLMANYAYSETWTLGLGYMYEQWKSSDWATDGVDPMSDTLPQVLTMSGSVSDYDAHIGMMYLTYHFSGEK